jgi:hypothetical protein
MNELDLLVVEFEIQLLRQTIAKLQAEQRIHYTQARVDQISSTWNELQVLLIIN